MKINSFVGKVVSAATAAAMMAAGFTVFPAGNSEIVEIMDSYAADAVVVDTTTEYQTIVGFGGINHPEWTGKDMTEAQRKTAFGNSDNELGLTVLRVFVNPNSAQWNLAVPTAKYASEHGVTVFASPWEPPSNLAASGGTGGLKGKLHLPESNYAAYAEHLNNFGTYMKNNGVDLYSISVQNEPDYAEEWTAWTPEQTTKFIAEYGDKITSTRLMSPESFQYGAWNNGKDYYKQILANPKAFANCDLFGTHFYGTGRNQMDFPELESCGKQIWMTEVYVPNSEADSANRWPEAVQVAENIHNGLVVGNMSAYVWWYIRRSYGLMTEDGAISKRGYCMAQYSKWVRPGDIRIGCTEQPQSDVYVSAYKNDNKQVTIVAVNKGSTEYTQGFNIGSGEKIVNVERFRTSGNENLANTPNMENSGSGFYSQLPANSVSTFVVSLEGSGSVPGSEPDENGYYIHDPFEASNCDWSGRGSATVMTSGRTSVAGSESLLVQERASAWNGASKSLSTRVFKPGESYSFSVCATYNDGADVNNFFLKLQYTGSDGETHYSEIAAGKTVAGKWVQLTNTNYTIPEGASDVQVYVETEEGTDSFYIDEFILAVAGTKIDGPGTPEIPEPTNTAPTTTQPSTPAPTNPNNPSVSDFVAGDANCDGQVTMADAAAILQYLGNADKYALSALGKLGADCDGNAGVTTSDALAIQEYLVGVRDKLIGAVVENPPVTDPETPSAKMRTISEYTPIVEQNMVISEPNDSKTEKGGVQYGTLQQKSYYSSFCNREKKYNVLLPAGYTETKKYPVLYVMHGYWENQDRMIIEGNGTMYTKQIIGNAIAEGAAKEMIVVFPYIYSSQTQADCSAMDDANNLAYDNFDTVLTTELMPLIEKEYSVATGRENTAITGFSMGGRESLNIGMKHPDMFGYVGAICPAPGASGAWKFESEEAAPSLIFITAGGNDTVVYSTPNGYHENFTNNNVPHIWHYYEAGYHGDNSIHAHLYNFVRAVFQA